VGKSMMEDKVCITDVEWADIMRVVCRACIYGIKMMALQV